MSRRRSPGRPGRDSEDLRCTLIDAALTCYTREGVAATSIKAIAAEAGVTPALLHYYFGSRDQLRQAVIDDRILPLIQAVQEKVHGAGEDVAALIGAFMDAMNAAVTANPWWPALWVREVLCEGGALREVLIEKVGRTFLQAFVQRFAAAQQRGELNGALDPRLLLVSLLGLTLFPAAGAAVWRKLLDADDLGPAEQQKHTAALLERGLELRHGL
ncbi:TetR/AcrR family transcriptional regulator [Microbulbifer hainanensis]|uniref:TetR/AcrR family transcriptional regulator n=1 Tax=Microbulbifer hainanensis TaxID=2735675 RepID=UPI0018683817|nr:TetR/AcrR family transcriptional regulator [Microbulbifer hainanensis]